MTMGTMFRSFLVPVELESAKPGEIALGRSVEVGDHDWVAVGQHTVRALELAAWLAGRDGEVCIVHATPDFTRHAGWMSASRIAELEDDASRYAGVVLGIIANRYCPGVLHRFVIEPGKAIDIILATASSLACDAIVLAASARPRLNRVFLGSTADKVIRQSSCPVMVVPSAAR